MNSLVKKNKALLLSFIAIICCMTIITRYYYLYNQPYLWGPDAYYYALQIKYLVQTGMFKIADRSLILPLMGLTSKLGFNYEQSILGWTILIQLLFGFSLVIAQRLKHKRLSIFPSYFLLLYVIISPTLSYLCLAFPRYAFALIFLPFWSLGFNNAKYWPISIAAIILSGISHLSMIGIAILVITIALLRGDIRFRRFNIKTLFFFGFIFSLTLIVLVGRKYILLADFNRISWDGLKPPLLTFFQRDGIQIILKLEAFLSLAIICGVLLFRKSLMYDVKAGALWSPFIIFLTLFPIGSGESMGISERLSLLLPAVTVCMSLGIYYLQPLVKKAIFIIISGGLILTIFAPNIYYHFVYPNKFNSEYLIYHQVTAAIEDKEIPMLIAHQGLNYFYKYQTMKESFPYEPEDHWPKDKIWRVVFGIRDSEWGYYLPEKHLWDSGFLLDLPGDYSLIREDVWNQFRNGVEQESQDPDLHYRVFNSWYNPNQKRPEFSRKRATGNNEGDEFSAYPRNFKLE